MMNLPTRCPLPVDGCRRAGPPLPPMRAASARIGGHDAIGRVLEISGSGAHDRARPARLSELADDPDPSVAMSGQVGSQVKIRRNAAGCSPTSAA